jgi:hypothetical protein
MTECQVCFKRYLAEFAQYGQATTGLSITPGYDLYRQEQAPSIPLWSATVLDFSIVDRV